MRASNGRPTHAAARGSRVLIRDVRLPKESSPRAARVSSNVRVRAAVRLLRLVDLRVWLEISRHRTSRFYDLNATC